MFLVGTQCQVFACCASFWVGSRGTGHAIWTQISATCSLPCPTFSPWCIAGIDQNWNMILAGCSIIVLLIKNTNHMYRNFANCRAWNEDGWTHSRPCASEDGQFHVSRSSSRGTYPRRHAIRTWFPVKALDGYYVKGAPPSYRSSWWESSAKSNKGQSYLTASRKQDNGSHLIWKPLLLAEWSATNIQLKYSQNTGFLLYTSIVNRRV